MRFTSRRVVPMLALLAILIPFTAFGGYSQVSTFAGGGSVFSTPSGIAITPAGELIVADNDHHQIKRVSQTGVVTVLAGTGVLGSLDGTANVAQFKSPVAVTYDAPRNLIYVADTQTDSIRKIDGSGNVTTFAATGFADPSGLAVDASGNVYVADTGNNKIKKITPAGVVTTIAGTGAAALLDGAALSAKFKNPYGLAITAAGVLYIADQKNHVIRKLENGNVTTIAGTGSNGLVDGAALSAKFTEPKGITFDSSGNLIVADSNNEVIRLVTLGANSTVSTIAGTGALGLVNGAPPASKFREPSGVVFNGTIYVADTGNNVIRAIAPDATVTGLSISPASATLTPGGTILLSAHVVYSDGHTADVTAGWSSSNQTIATVSQTGVVSAVAAGDAVITATSGSFSATVTIHVVPPAPLPPDPATVASPIDPTIVTTVFDSTRFLYSGANPIQTGVASGTIAKVRACVLRGTVRDRNLAPLPGVTISILGHPEFGGTRSRADGMFDLVVNGGGPVTVVYQKNTFVEAQRQIATTWNQFVIVPDVTLVAYDTVSTAIVANSAQYQVARGSTVVDDRGTRRATMLFAPNTAATVTLADGSGLSLPTMTIRASEYTVGPNGLAAMPAGLPPQTGFTYCVELSADEGVAAGARSISFSNPVAFYLENFLDFPVGMNVPVGFYDRARGVWVDQDNGLVVQIVAITAGRAYLDVTGDGLADDTDAAIGTTPAERDRLATLYPVGQKLWRASLTHFTPFDFNLLLATANSGLGAEMPDVDPAVTATPAENCSGACGSIIDVEDQVLREPIPVQGTPYSLMYSTRTAPGFTPGQDVDINASKGTVPATLTGISVSVSVAGQSAQYNLNPQPNQNVKFHWDGRDPYGRAVQGPAKADVSVRYHYPTYYWSTPSLRSIFAGFFGSDPFGLAVAEAFIPKERALGTSMALTLGHLDSRASDVAGWNLGIHHIYDPVSQTLYQGDGTVRVVKVMGPVVQTVTGSGTGTDNQAINLHLSNPVALASAPDGSTYVADRGTSSIYRIKTDGTYETVANGCCSASDGPASQTTLRPSSMAVDGNGTLYLLDAGSSIRVRTLSGGQVKTLAGGGSTEPGDDALPATSANLSAGRMAVAADGAIYLTGSSTTTRISPGGLIRNLAGNGSSGDGASARLASFQRASGVAVGPSGSVYITDQHNIRRVAPNGIIETLAPADNGDDSGLENTSSIALDSAENSYVSTGRGRIMFYDAKGNGHTLAGGGNSFGDNVPATAARLSDLRDLSLGADGAINFIDSGRIRRITGPLPGLGIDDMLVASEDGSQVYVFDQNGRHLRTVDSETGVVIYLFGYDTNGRLISVTDPDGNVTSIQRAPDGSPIAVVAPGGQQTTLVIGTDGYLSRAMNMAGEATALTNDGGGLLKTLTDARGGLHQFTYSADGRLINDQDPGGGFTGLARTGDERSFSVTKASAEGRSMTYQYSTALDGAVTRSVTDSAGLTTTSSRLANRTGSSQSPDGASTETTEQPDPRFGMQASITNSIFRTPNLGVSQSMDRSVTLSNPGDLLSVTSATEHSLINGRTYTRAFAALSHQTTFTTPAGRTMSAVLDEKNHVTSATSAGLASIGFTYDGRGLMTAAQVGTRQTLFSYDAQRRLSSATDPLQRTVSFAYDPADRVTTQTLPDGRQVHFSYDQNGNLTSVTPPSRPQHAFTYTSVDLNSSYTPPAVIGGGPTQYSYNHDKQLTLITRPDSSTIQFGYDGAGRLGTLTIGRGVYRYAYDGSTGNLMSITAPDDGVMQYSYDGSLLTDASWTGVVTGSIHWDYDSDFAIIGERVNCPTGTTLACQTVTLTYDNDKLLIGAGGLTLDRNSQNGLLTDTSIGALADAWTYNDFGEPLTYTASYGGAPLFSEQFTRDDVGRIAQKEEAIAGSSTTSSYGYDPSSRLTTVTTNGALTTTYTYDANSNRTSKATPSGSEAGACDDQDRITSYGGATYTYTANGDLETKTGASGTTAYTFDELGNLITASLPDGRRIDYVIDGQNRRIAKKIEGAVVQRLLYSDGLRLAAEIDPSGEVLARFIYGTRTNAPDLAVKGDTTYRIITDQLGSVRLVVNIADGTVAQRIDYDEFGNVLSDSNPGFQPFGFAGGLYDADTGLTRFGARDYDPQLGRWTAMDPIGFSGGDSNLYGYVLSDPVNLRDYNGLLPHSTLGGDDPGLTPEEIRQLEQEMKDPNTPARRRSEIQRRLAENRRRKSKRAQHHCSIVDPASVQTITAGVIVTAIGAALFDVAYTLLGGPRVMQPAAIIPPAFMTPRYEQGDGKCPYCT